MRKATIVRFSVDAGFFIWTGVACCFIRVIVAVGIVDLCFISGSVMSIYVGDCISSLVFSSILNTRLLMFWVSRNFSISSNIFLWEMSRQRLVLWVDYIIFLHLLIIILIGRFMLFSIGKDCTVDCNFAFIK